MSACICEVMTPPGAGAVAILQLTGDVDAGLRGIGVEPPKVGDVFFRELCGVDTGLVIRWSESCVQITPHGGRASTRALVKRLRSVGVHVSDEAEAPARSRWPEAGDDVEALMLDALARARSPLAIDLLLDQPRRWRAWDGAAPPPDEVRRVSAVLNRLIDPPTVVAVGRPNVGKSTLVNALARRSVSIVADEPGATRDHVGVTLELDGLAVRWIDTPGFPKSPAHEPEAQARDTSGAIEIEAAALARAVVSAADLVIVCVDAVEGAPALHEAGAGVTQEVMRIGTRADLGATPGADIATAAATGAGLKELTGAVRERLAPRACLAWSGPWIFDARLSPGAESDAIAMAPVD